MEWQPIQTAPKDGTRFWGRDGDDDDAVAMFWHPEFDAFISSFSRTTMARHSINGKPFEDHSPVKHKPTQWKPLTP